MCGHPVVFSIGIQHFGHLFVKNKKYINPRIPFKFNVVECMSTASHLGHFSSTFVFHLHFSTMKTQSQFSEGHFSISVVNDEYFLNNHSSSSPECSFYNVFKATHTSTGPFPSKGEIIYVPVWQDILVTAALICWCQQSQQMIDGSNREMTLSAVTQQISQLLSSYCSAPDRWSYCYNSCIINEQSDCSSPSIQQLLQNSMLDRLAQLKSMTGLSAGMSQDELGLHNAEDSEKYEDNEQEIEFGQKFAEEIKSVRIMISGLNANNKKIQTIKHQYAKAIKSAQERESSQEMNQILMENADYQKKIKQKLLQIQKSVNESKKNQPNEPETRMKRNFYLNLSKEVSDVLLKQQKFQEEYKITVKDKVTRQVKLIDRDLTEEEVQGYLNDPDAANRMLQKKIYGQASIQIKNTVSDIQDKLRDIQRLEASVNQCVILFNQLSALVFAQGQKIDSIEANVAECKDYIQKAEKKLVEGKKHMETSKKCMCIIILVASVILVIIIIAVVATR